MPTTSLHLQSKENETAPPTATTSVVSLLTFERDEIPTPLPPTDLGLTPWLQVLGGFFLMFNSWGLIVSHGTFQAYYTNGGIRDQSAPSPIAWIGSLQVFVFLFGGALSGKYFDAGYFRYMVSFGTFLVVFGLMMTSIATKYYQFMLAQGLCVGGGMSLFLVVSAGMPSTWFVRRRSIAVGLVTTGSPIAGVFYPILLSNLIPRLGFPWAVRILALISFVTLSTSLFLLQMRHPPRQRSSLLEFKALRELAFAFYTIGIFLTFLGWFNFYDFVESWAKAEHIHTNRLPADYIVSIVNAGSVIGRIIPNLIADRIGPLNVQAPSIAIAATMVLVWIPTHNLGPLLAISVIYGFFSGAVVSLPPTCVASMTEDMTSFGARVGIVFLAMSFSSLIGSPVAGALVQSGVHGYDEARIWSGVVMLVGAAFVTLARMSKADWRWIAKA
jgi:MFS family permease